LDYAHRRDVIHRDIKPANILLHEGQPVVSDFGIALAVSAAGGRRLTETGLSLGTPEYMSPEQAAGESAIDARSDLYSLGCVVYEMLLGEPPHTGPTAQSIIAKVITDEPRRVTKLRKTVPGHVEYAVHRTLAKLPADRDSRRGRRVDALRGAAEMAALGGAAEPGCARRCGGLGVAAPDAGAAPSAGALRDNLPGPRVVVGSTPRDRGVS
jgi:serine/threonine-protein kinase